MTNEKEKGKLTLIFGDNNNALSQWTIKKLEPAIVKRCSALFLPPKHDNGPLPTTMEKGTMVTIQIACK